MEAKSSSSGTRPKLVRFAYKDPVYDVCVHCLLLFFHHRVDRHSQCTRTTKPVGTPEQHSEAMQKRVEKLRAFAEEYRKHADYLESLLEQAKQE